MNIKLMIVQCEWLGAFLSKVNELAPVQGLEMETVICAELYEQYLKRWVMPREFTMNLKMSQRMALKEVLLEFSMHDEYSMIMRNVILEKIDRDTKTLFFDDYRTKQKKLPRGF
ncbi:MAG: hypothetical protein U5L45_05325 [Saprospiraceae bacterium]|nr:hypothetical protein [Saprospiraceae bacterium]